MADLAARFARDGFVVFDADARVTRWAEQAAPSAQAAAADPALKRKWLRHGETWFVGVDALPNEPDGRVGGVPLAGPWEDLVDYRGPWHRAQVSVTYRGYPRQDAGEKDAAHRYRVKRAAAHVDGLHLEQNRRILREPHAFILGLPLNDSDACLLTVWPGSHRILGAAFAAQIGSDNPMGADVTDTYKAIRGHCIEQITPMASTMTPGQSVLLHRHLLHGVAPWRECTTMPPEGRMVAYFRPIAETADDWLPG